MRPSHRAGLAGLGRSRSGGLVRWLPLVLFGLYFAWYYLGNRSEVPITGRSQLVDLSREQETALGLQSYRRILAESDVVASGEERNTVREVGRRLVAAAADMDPGFHWEFNLIRSPEANAFALPGGKTAVYTGLLPIAANVHGLSVVMGHEIAHALARHGAERMAHQKLVQIGTLAASFAVGEMDISTRHMVMGALGVGARYGVLMPFSRRHESEADRIGLILLARACFDPTEAPRLWQRMAAAGDSRAPAEMLSTHPDPQTRIEQFDAWMPEALAIAAQYCP